MQRVRTGRLTRSRGPSTRGDRALAKEAKPARPPKPAARCARCTPLLARSPTCLPVRCGRAFCVQLVALCFQASQVQSLVPHSQLRLLDLGLEVRLQALLCVAAPARVSNQAQRVFVAGGQATCLAALRRSRDRPHGRTSYAATRKLLGGGVHTSRPGWQLYACCARPAKGGHSGGPTSDARSNASGRQLGDAAVLHRRLARHGQPGPWPRGAAPAQPAHLARGCCASPPDLLAVRCHLWGAATCLCSL